jgi:hypothetical protein
VVEPGAAVRTVTEVTAAAAVVVVTGTDVVVFVVVAAAALVVVVAEQLGVEMVSVSSVTAPFSARTRPSIVTPVVTVMLWAAKMVPTKLEAVPSVAELPTCQKTLHACAPFVSTTRLADAVVSVEPA